MIRRLVGCMALLLGTLGVILSLGLIVGTWWLAQSTTSTLRSTATALDGWGARIDQRLVESQTDVEALRTKIQDGREQLLEALSNSSPNPVWTPEDLTRLEKEVWAQATQISLLLEIFDSSQALLDSVERGLESLAQIGPFSETDGERWLTSWREARANLSQVEVDWERWQTEWNELRQSGDLQTRAAQVQTLTERADDLLSRLTRGLEQLRQLTEQVRDGIAAGQRQLSDWVRLATFVLTALGLWSLWAQASLFRGGWLRWRSRVRGEVGRTD